MPLYLAEVYCKEDQARLRIDYWRSFRWFSARCDTQSQTLASNEEAKIILVLDIQDHSLTFAIWRRHRSRLLRQAPFDSAR
jgi:hypothetical protein